jgi:hypothetical protein
MEYHFSQHVTKEDYVAFLMNHLKMNLMRPFNLILFTFGLGYLLIAPFVTGDFTFTLIGLTLVVVMVFSVFLARFNAGRRYEKNKHLFDMSYRVDDETFSYMLGDKTIDKKWMDFFSANETKEYLYIFASKDSGSVLIKREIPNDAIAFIKAQLRAHVDPKRVKLLPDDQTTE